MLFLLLKLHVAQKSAWLTASPPAGCSQPPPFNEALLSRALGLKHSHSLALFPHVSAEGFIIPGMA